MSEPHSKILENLDAMLSSWNERDPSQIRGYLAQALSPEVVFVDPNYAIQGLDAFEQMVRAVQAEHPGMTAARTSGVDAHHDICRYRWRVTLASGDYVDGMDVTRLDAKGKILRVDGFFGPFPEKE